MSLFLSLGCAFKEVCALDGKYQQRYGDAKADKRHPIQQYLNVTLLVNMFFLVFFLLGNEQDLTAFDCFKSAFNPTRKAVLHQKIRSKTDFTTTTLEHYAEDKNKSECDHRNNEAAMAR